MSSTFVGIMSEIQKYTTLLRYTGYVSVNSPFALHPIHQVVSGYAGWSERALSHTSCESFRPLKMLHHILRASCYGNMYGQATDTGQWFPVVEKWNENRVGALSPHYQPSFTLIVYGHWPCSGSFDGFFQGPACAGKPLTAYASETLVMITTGVFLIPAQMWCFLMYNRSHSMSSFCWNVANGSFSHGLTLWLAFCQPWSWEQCSLQ